MDEASGSRKIRQQAGLVWCKSMILAMRQEIAEFILEIRTDSTALEGGDGLGPKRPLSRCKCFGRKKPELQWVENHHIYIVDVDNCQSPLNPFRVSFVQDWNIC